MARDFGEEIRQIKNTSDLLRIISGLESEGLEINDFPIIRLILENLEIDGDLPISVIINQLESLGGVEINPGLFAAKAERRLEQGVVPTAKIRELLEEYEKHLESGRAPDQALKELTEQYNGRISMGEVERLIKKQQEIYQQAVSKLKAETRLGLEEIEQAAEEIAEQMVIMEEKTAGQLPPDKTETLSRVIREEVIRATTERVLGGQVEPTLEEEIRKVVKELEPEKKEFIVEQATKIPAVSMANLKVNVVIKAITDQLIEELKSPNQIGALAEERAEELRKIIRVKVLEIVKGKIVGVEELSKAINEETNTAINTSVRKAIETTEKFVKGNAEAVARVREKFLGEEIEAKIIATMPTKQEWAEKAPTVRRYSRMILRIVRPWPELEKSKIEEGVRDGKTETAWRQARGLAILKMPPGEFNRMVREYWEVRQEIKQIPHGIEEVNAVEEIMRLGREPETRNFINLGQRAMRIHNGFNRFTGGWLKRLGFEELGNKFLGRIGGEEVGAFFRNSVKILTESGGLREGLVAIIKGLVGGSTSSATGGILATIGGLGGPMGWLGTGATMGGRAIFGGLGGVGGKLFGTAGKFIGGKLAGLGGTLGRLFRGAIPKLAAKLGTMGATALGGVLAIPSLVTISAAAIGTVVIAVIVGLFAYSMLQSWQISSVVQPMTGSGNQNVEYIPGAPGLAPETIEGECSLADHVTGIKQNYGTWADKELPNGCTFTKSGCGPTSVAKILTRINQTLTPDYLVYEENSTYASMGCDGSSMNQAKLTLEKHLGAGKVVYDSVTRGCNKKDIGEWIKHGKIVMVLADFYSNSEASKVSGHYTLAVALSGGEIITSDPFYQNGPAFDGKREYSHVYKINECLLIDTGEGCL